MNTSLKDKVLGSLFGFAIGDAMGAATEFMSASQIKLKYGQVTEILGGGWLNLKAGSVTDDTQMTLCVAEAMMEHWPHVDEILQAICENFVCWVDSHPVDIGGACLRSISDNKGKPWKEWAVTNRARQKGLKRHDLGNGGLMRCLVPCLIGNEYLALKQASLTHTNPQTTVAVGEYYQIMEGILEDGMIKRPFSHKSPTGHVTNTLHNAVYWASAPSFQDCIIGAVNDGGDADTIAALAGGLAGARWGYSSIPKSWLEKLDERVATQLEEIAEFICTNREVHNEV